MVRMVARNTVVSSQERHSQVLHVITGKRRKYGRAHRAENLQIGTTRERNERGKSSFSSTANEIPEPTTKNTNRKNVLSGPPVLTKRLRSMLLDFSKKIGIAIGLSQQTKFPNFSDTNASQPRSAHIRKHGNWISRGRDFEMSEKLGIFETGE